MITQNQWCQSGNVHGLKTYSQQDNHWKNVRKKHMNPEEKEPRLRSALP